jgi:hypothetical protein
LSRRTASVLLAALVALAGALSLVAPAGAAPKPSKLEQGLLDAVRSAAFGEVVDFGAGAAPAPQTRFMPNVDVAVIELNGAGRAVRAANVVLSRTDPEGRLVPIDKDLGTSAVAYRRWDTARWDEAGKGYLSDPAPAPSEYIVPGSEDRPIDFLSPYPASLFKTMVAVQVMRVIDQGRATLDTTFTYAGPSTGCPSRASAGTFTLREQLDDMITISGNASTCRLLAWLHQLPGGSQVDAMNDWFASLGLTTLQVRGTNRQTGGSWIPGQITMGALDTARLFYLIEGAPGVLWKAPDGRKVKASELSDASRAFLRALHADQAFHEVLSTSLYCGQDYPAQGIPSLVPTRWVDPATGTVEADGVPYSADVRPCNAAAEVLFAHKTGLTTNAGSDAGIVTSLPGQPRRRYVVSVLSNLGYRFGDPSVAGAAYEPCFGSLGAPYPEGFGPCYTEKLALLGRSIDELLTKPGA